MLYIFVNGIKGLKRRCFHGEVWKVRNRGRKAGEDLDHGSEGQEAPHGRAVQVPQMRQILQGVGQVAQDQQKTSQAYSNSPFFVKPDPSRLYKFVEGAEGRGLSRWLEALRGDASGGVYKAFLLNLDDAGSAKCAGDRARSRADHRPHREGGRVLDLGAGHP